MYSSRGGPTKSSLELRFCPGAGGIRPAAYFSRLALKVEREVVLLNLGRGGDVWHEMFPRSCIWANGALAYPLV